MHRQEYSTQTLNEKNILQTISNNMETSQKVSASKADKNILNERQATKIVEKIRDPNKDKDDMEQWISDSFYRYFPGFSNENKKRQDLLRDRQLEFQKNFLKHQLIEEAAKTERKKNNAKSPPENQENEIKKPSTSRSDKTELEIIVNNPDYHVKSPRPGSARDKLLQDLKHTEISKIVNYDGVKERNQRNAEQEMMRKKVYQKELIAQIEEKRRTIEILKEKEREHEEALTKKLQDQLKIMRLEEQLEKQKILANKVQLNSEQNCLLREHLLINLENDSMLFSPNRKSFSDNGNENKVYKYFSNSARHEFRRESLDEPIAFQLDLPETANDCLKKNCYDAKNICPFCESQLKRYESWCRRCEGKMYAETELENLVCNTCEKVFLSCDKTSYNPCTYCHMNRNFWNCRKKNYCCHSIVAEDNRKSNDSERSFQILEVKNSENHIEDMSPKNASKDIDDRRAPYSINIDRNSIYHRNFDLKIPLNDEYNIESIRHETDKRLSKYLKNYGGLAYKVMRDGSTQTSPDNVFERDIIALEENNLSMPLLREMPRMTRKESNLQEEERSKKESCIAKLSKRWEVPAVQKHSITNSSPKVLIQLGAIRKQLQSEQF